MGWLCPCYCAQLSLWVHSFIATPLKTQTNYSVLGCKHQHQALHTVGSLCQRKEEWGGWIIPLMPSRWQKPQKQPLQAKWEKNFMFVRPVQVKLIKQTLLIGGSRPPMYLNLERATLSRFILLSNRQNLICTDAVWSSNSNNRWRHITIRKTQLFLWLGSKFPSNNVLKCTQRVNVLFHCILYSGQRSSQTLQCCIRYDAALRLISFILYFDLSQLKIFTF